MKAPLSVAEKLAEHSSLTRIQLETLSLRGMVLSGEISVSQSIERRLRSTKGERTRKGPVSAGTYYRVLRQAKNNVRSSILTVLTAMWLGYVKFDDLARLLELVGRSRGELAGGDADRLMGVLNALLDRIVT